MNSQQHVAVRVHHGLGRAGGAAGEGQQGDVVGRRGTGLEGLRRGGGALLQRARRVRRIESQNGHRPRRSDFRRLARAARHLAR